MRFIPYFIATFLVVGAALGAALPGEDADSDVITLTNNDLEPIPDSGMFCTR
jgi:hypothetical protein